AVPGGARNVQDIYPLAPLQEGILFHHLLTEEGTDPYVISALMEVPTKQALDEWLRAMQAVMNRHDALRTAVLWEGLPRPVQVVYREAQLPVQELAVLESGQRPEELRSELGISGESM